MTAVTPMEALLKRDRVVVLAGLAGVTGLAWFYLIAMAAGMSDMGSMAVLRIKPWTGLEFLLMFLMWAVMMVAMMLPGAAPMMLLYGLFVRKQRARGHVFASVGLFAAGYLLAWTAYSLAATLLQWGLEQAALLSPMMVTRSPILGGALLIAAGVYQWTPVKNACLENCRSPVDFLSRHWRHGNSGAVAMGLHHGLYCVGCCWFLMALLFVGGVMNLLWVAAIAGFILIEKATRFGVVGGRVTGALLTVIGAFVMAEGLPL